MSGHRTDQQIAAMICHMAGDYQGIELTDGMIARWVAALDGCRPEQVSRAITLYGQSPDRKFWPKPGDLLRYIDRDDGVLSADAAWAEIIGSHCWEGEFERQHQLPAPVYQAWIRGKCQQLWLYGDKKLAKEMFISHYPACVDEYAGRTYENTERGYRLIPPGMDKLPPPEEKPAVTYRKTEPEPATTDNGLRRLPWEIEGISRDKWIAKRVGRPPEDAPPPPRRNPPPREGREWTRQQALESLKGRKPILPGYD